MAQLRSLKQLQKVVSYILGRNPAEFGLVPDPDGFVKIKEFLKVVHEERGLKHIRRPSIDEIMISIPNPLIEIRGNHIRSKEFQASSGYQPARNIPKLLFTCVRRKAYSFVVENGIFPMGFSHVILSSNSDMAKKIGRRRDHLPVQLVVQTQKCMEKGTIFYEAGETLYLAESIQTGCFTGPPLPKQKEPFSKKDIVDEPALDRMPGSFMLELKEKTTHDKASQHKKKQKEAAWKKETKKIKKQKRKRRRPPWRQ